MMQRPASHENRAPHVSEVVDSLGLGFAQVWIFALAHGVWFTSGCAVALVNVLVPAIGEELQLGNGERASLAALLFAGIAVGSALSGFFGDNLGRKPPILFSYLAVAVFQIGSGFARAYWFL